VKGNYLGQELSEYCRSVKIYQALSRDIIPIKNIELFEGLNCIGKSKPYFNRVSKEAQVDLIEIKIYLNSEYESPVSLRPGDFSTSAFQISI
jgi:hypothetical protein